MRFRRTVLALFSIFATTHTILAQSQPSLTNIIQADGSVKALYESQPVVTAQFWMFRDNWTRVQDWTTTGNGTNTFQREGNLYPGTVAAKTTVANSSNGTAITFQATPSRTVLSNDDHMNFMFDEAFWAGSVLSDGSTSVSFSANFMQPFTRTGTGRVITVTRPDGFKVTITTPQNVKWAVQDSRGYHFGFELRLDERSGNWAAGASKTYQATVKYTNASNTNPDAPMVVTEGDSWRPLTQSMSVQKGSALDWQDTFAPVAGSQGWLKVNANGKFYFQNSPNKVQRFYGANLAHYACFPSKTEAPILADNLARMGYNAVRLHHIDYILTDPTPGNSTTIDPGRMDLLNFFINELKKRGIYISLDLHSLRKPRQNEVITGWPNEGDYKALLFVSPQARQNYLAYSSNLMNTTNPYTGLKWKDDPAIAWIALDNENSPMWLAWPRSDIKTMLDLAVGGSWNPLTGDGSRAAVNLAADAGEYLATQLRGMGIKSLLSNMNAGFERALSIGRVDLDYVDNHMYFAHPDTFGLPVVQKSTSPLRKVEELGWFAASRIKGKPFTVTEFDGVAPNQFRAEFGLMAGAMGVVQQWDGMWRFQYADNMGRALQVQPMGLFSLAGDPLNMATERAIVAMFLRGDLATNDAPYQIANYLPTADQSEIRTEPVVRQSVLGKPMAQVNTQTSSGSGIIVDGNSNNKEGTVSVNLNALNMKIQTPNTVSLVGSEGLTATAGILTSKFIQTRASIYLTSVDKKPLDSSRRMLLAHLTDVQNSGATFSGQERNVLTSWGGLPHLVKVGTAEVTIKVKYPANMRVYRLDLAGKRTETVPMTKLSNAIKFNVSTRDLGGYGGLYYEIVSTK